MLNGRVASLERIYLDYDGRIYLGVTIDSDPMQEVMRDTGRYHFFFADEVELIEEAHEIGGSGTGHHGDGCRTARKQVLVAAVGNLWLRDDGFGSEVATGSSSVGLPAGVSVVDFGTGGLDLAYEVMRGYDALVLVDVSRQGGAPGTLYVMEVGPGVGRRPDRGRRGDRPARDGSADGAPLRQGGRRLAGQGDRGRVRAGAGRGDGHRPERLRRAAVDNAVDVVAHTVDELVESGPA